MSTRILSAGKFTKVLYDGPTKREIQIKFESSEPVDVYGVSLVVFDEFKKSRSADLFSFRQKTKLNKTLSLKPVMVDEWYLIVENRSESPVAIHYEVFDV